MCTRYSFRKLVNLAALASVMASPGVLRAQEISFHRAIELAIHHSSAIASAEFDAKRAEKNYDEIHGAFLPQLTAGAALGYSYGFPQSLEGSTPTVFTLNSQQSLFNPGLKLYLRAAREGALAAKTSLRDRRDRVILETASAYLELAHIEAGAELSCQQRDAAVRMEKVSGDRLLVGLDSGRDVTNARLVSARIRLALAQLQTRSDELRAKLAELIGVPARTMKTINESIPPLPNQPAQLAVAQMATIEPSLVTMMSEQANAKSLRAEGDKRFRLPSVDAASQYAVLGRHNNYDIFFNRRRFQNNNLTAGGVIRLLLLNPPKRAQADISTLEAMKARLEVQEARDQSTLEILKLKVAIANLQSAREIARLEYQIAGSDLRVALVRIDSGGIAVRDLEMARLQEQQKQEDFLQADLELQTVRMQLLRATGEIEHWALELPSGRSLSRPQGQSPGQQ